MVCKPIIEFLLWNDCLAHGKCAFCWQQAKHECSKFLNDEEKINSINCVSKFLDNNFAKLPNGENNKHTGNHILLVGGEIFDIESDIVKKELIELIKKIIKMMCNNEIELLYINTNLLYKDLTLIDWFLSMIQTNGLFDRLRFTTSWDIAGRFETEEKKDLFDKNLKKIRADYPEAHIVVNSILTKQYCEKIIENPSFVKDFQDMYKVQVNTIPYIVLTDWLAPTKNQVMKALLSINSIIPNYVRDYVNNFSLPQPKLLYEYNSKDKDLIYCSSDIDECGHSENFKNYCTDSKKCYICDIKQLLDRLD